MQSDNCEPEELSAIVADIAIECGKYGYVEAREMLDGGIKFNVVGQELNDGEIAFMKKISAAKLGFYFFNGEFRKPIGLEKVPFDMDIYKYSLHRMQEYSSIVDELEKQAQEAIAAINDK